MSSNVFRKSSLDRISSPEQLNDYIKVSNPSVWIVIAAMFILLAAIGYWSFAGSLPTSFTCNSVSQQSSSGMVDNVICYVSPDNAQSIIKALNSPNGTANTRVYPKETALEQYGYITGKVIAVGNNIVSAEDVRESLHDDAIAAALLPNEFGVYVKIALDHNPAQPKQLNWSNGDKDGNANLLDSTICSTVIITQEEQPITFLTK